MACYIFDIDGTIVDYCTSEWLPGAKEYLEALASKGHRIIFLTMRSNKRDANTVWSEEKTEKLLSVLSFSYDILYNVPSPRIIYDDSEVVAKKRRLNSDWLCEIESFSKM